MLSVTAIPNPKALKPGDCFSEYCLAIGTGGHLFEFVPGFWVIVCWIEVIRLGILQIYLTMQ